MASAAHVTTALPAQVVVHKDLVEGGKFLKWTEQVRFLPAAKPCRSISRLSSPSPSSAIIKKSEDDSDWLENDHLIPIYRFHQQGYLGN